MESTDQGNYIDLNNVEVLFEFEINSSGSVVSQNQIVTDDAQSMDSAIDQPIIDLDEFFSYQYDDSTLPNENIVIADLSADNTESPKCDEASDQSVVEQDDFAVDNTSIDGDTNITDTFGPNEIVRAVKVKKLNKRDSARFQRDNGKEYLGYSCVGSKVLQNIVRAPRLQGPRCNSKFCARSSFRYCNLFAESERKILFNKFWKMNWNQKQIYICQLIEKTSIKERKADETSSRRKCSKKYFLINRNGKRVQVCLKMFLKTFGLKEKMVRLWMDCKDEYGLIKNPIEVQQRKNTKRQQSAASQALLDRKIRLLSFLIDYPKVESHYCRKDTGKEYFQSTHQTLIDLYKDYVNICGQEDSVPLSFPVFSGTMKNLNFCLFKPRKDQCDTCMGHKVGNVSPTVFDNHRKNVDRASREKEKDVIAANLNEIILLCMDTEGVVLCPKLLASALYFKSKLQLHNFTIYDILTHASSNYVWDETEGDLSSSSFTSIVVHHLKKLFESHEADSLPITIYSDGCGYQNRNVVMSNALRLLAMKYSRVITQKFLEVGHTHMECDSTHACIERKARGMVFNLPADFELAVATARDKPFPFHVERLTHTFFRNYDDQEYLTYKSIRPGKKAGDPKVTHIRCLQYDPDGKVLYKLNFDDEFKLLPQPTKRQTILEPRQLHDQRLPVSNSKWKHLQELKAVLPSESHPFYDNIPHLGEPEKIVTENDKLENLMAKVKFVKATSTKKKSEKKVAPKNVPKKIK